MKTFEDWIELFITIVFFSYLLWLFFKDIFNDGTDKKGAKYKRELETKHQRERMQITYKKYK